MSAPTQSRRYVRLVTPLGEDALLFKSMIGEERLGQPFRYELTLLSEAHALDYRKITGQKVTIVIDLPGKQPRYFNGYVSRIAQTHFEGRLTEYRATIVPWLSLLTLSSDCRIFQNMSIPEILQQVFADHGFSDVLLRLQDTYKTWEYCVQYQETAFNFVSRLMEREGIYYFFEHEKDRHSLILCDRMAAHKKLKGCEELFYNPSQTGTRTRNVVWRWSEEHELQSGAYGVTDFDFKRPRRNKVSRAEGDSEAPAFEMERFDYLGEMGAESDGTRYGLLRFEQMRSQQQVYSGEGDAYGIVPGGKFKLRRHPRRDLEQEYLTTGANFQVEAAPFESTKEGQAKFVFEATLTAIPITQEFKSLPATPKPSIPGAQTAIVVGPKDEEIYTDKYGRVKVHFHWDRHDKSDENSSCWMRVAQIWAGKKWGAIYTPRVGQEVVVEFLEGDPDRPLITGRVFNDAAQPPYDLPAHKTITTIKSNSSKNGDGFNEIRFDDKKGSEQVFIHGEKNFDVRIKNNAYEWVGNNRHLIVKNDQIERVENSHHEIIDKDHVEKVGRDRHLKVAGKEAKSVEGSLSLTVKGDVIELFKAKHSEQTADDYYLKAANVIIEGMSNVTIKVGDSYIAIEAGGIKISTPQLELKGQATADLKSPMTTIQADGVLTLKGGLVKVN